MPICGHQSARRKVTDSDIEDEIVVKHIFCRGIKATSNVVTGKPGCGWFHECRGAAVVHAIMHIGDVQKLLLQRYGQVRCRVEIKMDSRLFYVLVAKQIDKSEGIVITGVLLIECADTIWIPVRITGGIVVFPG